MCYQRHIKDIVGDIIDIVEKVVYDTYNWNLTYVIPTGILFCTNRV